MSGGATDGDPERRRVGTAYQRYAASGGRRRAWSADNPGNVAIREELVGAVWRLAGAQLGAASAVLDVGCGTGWWLKRLAADARVSAGLHGVELLAERAAAASERVPAAAIRLGDARALPFADRSFDLVTLFTVLSSLATRSDAAAAIDEARRMLRSGGALLIWEPRLPNPRNRDALLIGRRLIREALDGMAIATATTTVLPQLARHLGPRTETVYPVLAHIRALRTHRLVCAIARETARRDPGSRRG